MNKNCFLFEKRFHLWMFAPELNNYAEIKVCLLEAYRTYLEGRIIKNEPILREELLTLVNVGRKLIKI